MSSHKTSELVTFLRAANLVQQLNVAGSGKFGYALAINKRRLQAVGEAFDEQIKALVEKHAERDETGALVVEGEGDATGTKISDVPAFNAAVRELESVVIENVDFHKIEIDALPATLGAGIVDGLLPMIQEPA